MKKLIVFLKPLVLLMLSFVLSAFLFCNDDDEDKTCSDAATNATNVLMAELAQSDICDLLYSETDMTYEEYTYCNSVEDSATFRTELTAGLADWCTSEPWSQASINCIAEANSADALENCP